MKFNALPTFRDYSIERKIKTLFEYGTFVTAIRYYKHKVNLYLLEGHYVEVFVNHKKGVIDYIELLDHSHSRMKFYYDQIKLPKDLGVV